MSTEDDPEYYAARERHARELAEAAGDPHVRAIHLDMARRYADLRTELNRQR